MHVRVVQVVVQATRLLALQGAVDDEFGHLQQVAQLQQVVGDPEVGVVLLHLLLEQVDAALGPGQAFVGTHYPHVVPHHQPQLVPVVLDHHQFVRIFHLALVPHRQTGRLHAHRQLGQDVGPRLMGIDHAFEQGVGGHPVGAVQPGVGHLADGIEAGDVGLAVVVDHHAAAGVVSGRDDGHRLLGDVDADRKAALVDGREVLDDEVGRLVADVQIHAVGA